MDLLRTQKSERRTLHTVWRGCAGPTPTFGNTLRVWCRHRCVFVCPDRRLLVDIELLDEENFEGWQDVTATMSAPGRRIYALVSSCRSNAGRVTRSGISEFHTASACRCNASTPTSNVSGPMWSSCGRTPPTVQVKLSTYWRRMATQGGETGQSQTVLGSFRYHDKRKRVIGCSEGFSAFNAQKSSSPQWVLRRAWEVIKHTPDFERVVAEMQIMGQAVYGSMFHERNVSTATPEIIWWF